MLSLKEPVYEVDSSLDSLWKQSELHLDHDEPVYENFAVFRSQLRLLFKVVFEGFRVELSLEKGLMYGLNVVALHQFLPSRHSHVVDDALGGLLERLSIRINTAR